MLEEKLIAERVRSYFLYIFCVRKLRCFVIFSYYSYVIVVLIAFYFLFFFYLAYQCVFML